MRRLLLSVVVGLALLSARELAAEVTRVEIVKRLPFAEGRAFDGTGPYQRLLGRVHFAVDPQLAGNRGIIDLELAPRNAQGRVEFSADLEILAPVDINKSNGTLLYDVNNRGFRKAHDLFDVGAEHFLARKGYVVVWSGWLCDVPQGAEWLRLDAPVARDGANEITGPVRVEMSVDQPKDRWNISNRPHLGGYEPTERGLPGATLTWRLRESDPRVMIPRTQWKLHTSWHEVEGKRVGMPMVELELAGGLQPGCLYELIYEARNPVVQGLGLAGIRDLVSFLRHDDGERNPLRGSNGKSAIARTIGTGISQSGRCLRVMLHEGFNADEKGRRVFDGMLPLVSGGGLGFFNHRFAAPSRYNEQHFDHQFPVDVFPFAYGPDRDPVSGHEDGILNVARRQQVVPKIMHMQTSAEYWHRSGSLVHTDPLGKQDAEVPPEVRLYSVAGAQHGPGNDVPAGITTGQVADNPTDYRPVLRALLVALDAWIRDEAPPPPSVYPRIADGTLVDWRGPGSGWKGLPGIRYPQVIQQPAWHDYGPDFPTKRQITKHPPERRGDYRVLVAAVGPDHNERGMLRLPSIAVPVGTFTGWNLRHRTIGAENELIELRGGFIPLAKTAPLRNAVGDPRLALQERYRDFGAYLDQYETVVQQLIDQRYLLPEDRKLLIDRALGRRPLFDN